MIIKKCDRCGNEEIIESIFPIFGEKMTGGYSIMHFAGEGSKMITLCEKCEKDFTSFINDNEKDDEEPDSYEKGYKDGAQAERVSRKENVEKLIKVLNGGGANAASKDKADQNPMLPCCCDCQLIKKEYQHGFEDGQKTPITSETVSLDSETYPKAYDMGYKEGYDYGHENGFDEGYQKGLKDGKGQLGDYKWHPESAYLKGL